MIKLVLHGELGKKFGKEYTLQANSAVEGVKALSYLIPEFAEYFAQGEYYVYTGTPRNKTNLTEETIHLQFNGATVNIVPSVVGAKRKGVGKLIAGIAMVGIAFIPGLNGAVFGALGGVSGTSAGVSSAAASMFSSVTTASQLLFTTGLTLALGGAAQLTAPKVGESKESDLFSGTPDSVEEGTPVPLVYGKYLALGYPVSFEIITGMNSYSGTSGSTGGGGTGGGGGGSTGGWDSLNLFAVA